MAVQVQAASTEVLYWLHQNRQYSVYDLTSINGSVVEFCCYNAYGKHECLSSSGISHGQISTSGHSITFTGRVYDYESMMVYFRHRMYANSLGRFIGRDPLKYVDGRSQFANYFTPQTVDPTGTVVPPLVLGAAGTCAVIDGPIPIGDCVAICILGGWWIYATCIDDPPVLGPDPRTREPRTRPQPDPGPKPTGPNPPIPPKEPKCEDKTCWCCEISFHGALADYRYTISDCDTQDRAECEDASKYCLPPGTKEGKTDDIP